MTAAAAVAVELTPFDGKKVIATTIKVTKAGDGLSSALAIEPQEMHLGQKVYVVLECDVEKVQFGSSSDSDDLLIRQHILATATATIVPRETVIEMLTAQRLKIERARDLAKGQHHLTDENGAARTDLADFDGKSAGEDDDGFYDPANDPDATDVDDALAKQRKKRGGKKDDGGE